MRATNPLSAIERCVRRMGRVPMRRLALAAVLVLGLLGLQGVAAPAAPAPPPPLDGCLANVPFPLSSCFGFGNTDYGNITAVVQHATTIGTEVTLQTDPEDVTTPILCGDLGCVYRSVNWKWDSTFLTGIQVVSGCQGNDFTCTVRYVGQGVGDAAETWQPVFVRHFYGVNPSSGIAHAFYAPPKIYPVKINTMRSNGDPYDVRSLAVSFLVRQGTNPNVSACLPYGWYAPYQQSATVPVPDCIIANNQHLDDDPTFEGFLPNDSGTWDVLSFDKTIGSFPAGPVRANVSPFTAATVTPSGDDMVVDQTFLARPQLDVAIEPSDTIVEIGQTVQLDAKVTAVGGDAGSIDGIKFNKTGILDNGVSYSLVGTPDPVPPAAGFSLTPNQTRSFKVTILGVAQGNAQSSTSVSGITDQGVTKSDTAFVNIHVVPAGSGTTTTLPTGSAPTPPVITSAVSGSGGPGSIAGTVEGEPNGSRTVSLASSGGQTCTKFMSGAGVTTLGSKTVDLDTNGHGTFSFDGDITTGAFVYGTSAKGAGVSAVGDCFTVTAPVPPSSTSTSTTSIPTSSSTSSTSTSTSTSTTSTSTSTSTTSTTVPPSSTSTSTIVPTSSTIPVSTTAPVTTTTTPASPAAPFVEGLYSGLLDRASDPAGLAYWTGRRDGGASARAVADGVVRSAEFRRLQVQEAYRTILGRSADPAALRYWTARLGSGATLGDLWAALLGSAEAWNRAGSNPAGFADLLYRSVLGRSPDPAGQAFVVGWLDQGRSREALAANVLASDEAFRGEASHWYRRLLDRAPTASEVAAWVAARRAGKAETSLIAELAASTA